MYLYADGMLAVGAGGAIGDRVSHVKEFMEAVSRDAKTDKLVIRIKTVLEDGKDRPNMKMLRRTIRLILEALPASRKATIIVYVDGLCP